MAELKRHEANYLNADLAIQKKEVDDVPYTRNETLLQSVGTDEIELEILDRVKGLQD